jgi:hypothetical protein
MKFEAWGARHSGVHAARENDRPRPRVRQLSGQWHGHGSNVEAAGNVSPAVSRSYQRAFSPADAPTTRRRLTAAEVTSIRGERQQNGGDRTVAVGEASRLGRLAQPIRNRGAERPGDDSRVTICVHQNAMTVFRRKRQQPHTGTAITTANSTIDPTNPKCSWSSPQTRLRVCPPARTSYGRQRETRRVSSGLHALHLGNGR